jgi:NAD(P)-dependent dehydrogenase (short-subunit alcohol dehydrogenase family)
MLQDSKTEELSMDRLKGKIALTTGGTSIGSATARLFQAEGATVIVTGASENSVKTATDTMPGIEAVHSNAADPQAAQLLVKAVAQKHNKIDILFVNAGIARVAAAADTEERQFDELFPPTCVAHTSCSNMPFRCSRMVLRSFSPPQPLSCGLFQALAPTARARQRCGGM